MKKTVTAVLVLAIIFMFCACSGGAVIAGKYAAENGDEIVFRSDDTYTLTYADDGLLGGIAEEGTYTIDGDTVTVTWNGLSTTGKFDKSAGTVEIYERVFTEVK